MASKRTVPGRSLLYSPTYNGATRVGCSMTSCFCHASIYKWVLTTPYSSSSTQRTFIAFGSERDFPISTSYFLQLWKNTPLSDANFYNWTRSMQLVLHEICKNNMCNMLIRATGVAPTPRARFASVQMRQLFSASYVQEKQARERFSNPTTTARWNDPELYGFRFAAAFWNFHLYPQMKSSMRKEKYFRCFTQATGAVYITRGRAFPLPLEKW